MQVTYSEEIKADFIGLVVHLPVWLGERRWLLSLERESK